MTYLELSTAGVLGELEFDLYEPFEFIDSIEGCPLEGFIDEVDLALGIGVGEFLTVIG